MHMRRSHLGRFAAHSVFPLSILLAAIGTASLAAPDDEGAYTIQEPRRTLDEIRQTRDEIPPVTYTPPSDRWERLPLTLQRLRNGPSLKIVALGDSIVNDTMRSGFVAMVDAAHPDCDVSMVTSVRGSTGCWWYQEPGRVERYILDHDPDLVLIGGISQRGDIDAIRSVIEQIRDASDAEILLMTEVFGRIDPQDEAWPSQIDPESDDNRAKLKRLAIAMDVGFFDIQKPWGEYIRSDDKHDLTWYKRDVVHANPRGEQILGQLMERYLTAGE